MASRSSFSLLWPLGPSSLDIALSKLRVNSSLNGIGWNVQEKSQFKVELRWHIWDSGGHTCYQYHINLRYVRFFFLKKEKYYGKPRYKCLIFMKTEVEWTLVKFECTAVVVVTCCHRLSGRHGFCQLSIFSVFLEVLLFFVSAHGWSYLLLKKSLLFHQSLPSTRCLLDISPGKWIEFDKKKTLRAKFVCVQHIAGRARRDEFSVKNWVCSIEVEK